MTQSLSPLDIRLELLRRKSSGCKVAHRLGITRQAVYMVIAGRTETPRIRRAIADEIGKSYLETWGEEDPGVDALPTRRARMVAPRVDSVTGVAS